MKPTRWSSDTWEEMNLVLLRRCRGRCEWCGKDLGDSVERHHRVRRSVGGDRLSNIVMLCPKDHRHAHGHPTEARERGVIVSTAGDPANVALVDHKGAVWRLDDDGGRTLLAG